MNKRILLLSIFFLIMHSLGFGQWQPCAGTAGLNVHCIAAGDSLLFAGTDNGVYFSADSGNTWTLRSNGITPDTVLALLIAGSHVFAGTNGGGIFSSINNGLSWQSSNNGISNAVIHCFTESGTKIFAGADEGAIFLSVDSGINWSLLNTGIVQTPVNALATKDTSVFAAHNFGISVSSDGGTTWTTTGITVTNFISFTVKDSEIYAGSGGDGIFYTADNFSTWDLHNNGMTELVITSMTTSATAVFAASAGNGVYVSTNHGANWTTWNTGLTDLVAQAVITSNGNAFAGTASAGIWRRGLGDVTSADENFISKGNELNLFPNPLHDNFTIELNAGNTVESEIKFLRIFNSCGEEVKKKIFQGRKCSLNVSDFEPGIYLIEVKSKESTVIKRVIKM
jgi:hypothetical protein